ncbi:4-hydroxythreonine-4-phosphate dehydrogenase 2 [Anaerohalosphaera lusitana]|uniref:4-hydroxythreonine-4-phosphate dehydrogenase 2 n=1 Tax=Anaerohalosphaera lusitana TaxID=1936003 RepID=A0A1U9NH30_9BACT|nr:4-hydroxythreonine-4-phosphate dehydrogenase PdxA [Anaerohalosphaera lusitana]AQT67242.1 4-hydroxythreonine-4-phosphate dehydrogenase 2 [Anaerohalosphaera lusitana]
MTPTGHSALDNRIVIGITMGDPGGVGPEIIVKALSDANLRREAKFIIFGSDEQLQYAADLAEVEPYWIRHQHEKISRDYPRHVVVADYDEYAIPGWIHSPNKVSGEASIKYCVDAIKAAQEGIIDGVVTAPISKVSWTMAGAKWPGHTEMFADQCKSRRKAMMFVGGPLKLALATIHEGLFEIRHHFTMGCVFEPIDLLNTALKEYFGVENPRIGVAGLNPHAGEDGQFGDEEERIIKPTITMAREVGIDCEGPFPADTLFLKAVRGDFDGVVAMYHDQGLIPIKLVAFDKAVNVTIGIPIIRTSPAHGTAFDIAGKGVAREESMKEAIKVAIEMAKTRAARDK